jgi:hypothetical protein
VVGGIIQICCLMHSVWCRTRYNVDILSLLPLALQQASFLGANFLVYNNELARQQTR